MLVTQAIDYFRNNAINKNLTEGTIDLYIRELQRFEKDLQDQGIAKLSDVKFYHIDAYLAGLIKKGNNANTRARKKSILDNFFRFCVTQEFIEKNHMDKIPQIKVTDVDQKKKEVLSIKEINKLLQQVENSGQSERNRLLIMIAAFCGLRVSELRHIKWSDIDKEEKIIRVLGKGGKERNVPLFEDIEVELSRYKKKVAGTTYVFEGKTPGVPITSRYILKMIKTYSKKANIEKNIGCHSLRRSAATNYLRDDVNVRYIQMLLGHNDISTTMRYMNPEEQEINKRLRESFNNLNKKKHIKKRS